MHQLSARIPKPKTDVGEDRCALPPTPTGPPYNNDLIDHKAILFNKHENNSSAPEVKYPLST